MSLNDKTVAGFLLQTVKKYIDKHISVLTTSLNNKNKTKRFKVSKGATSVATGTPFITNESLISFDRIIGNPATSIANIGVDGDYFVESGTIHFKEFNKDIVISCGVNYGVHDISHADVLGQGTTENDISVMKHELDMLSGSGIGHNGIYYIQDVGSKEAGKIYLDKTQEGVWKCLNTTSSINNTSDFERIDNTTLDDKLRNLYEINLNLNRYITAQFFHEGPPVQEAGYVEICSGIPLNSPYDDMYTIDIDNYQYGGGVSRKITISAHHFMNALHGANALVIGQYYKDIGYRIDENGYVVFMIPLPNMYCCCMSVYVTHHRYQSLPKDYSRICKNRCYVKGYDGNTTLQYTTIPTRKFQMV